jgi:hypothetical protein
MKWNDAEIYFASEATHSERHHWEMQKDDSGKYALIREETLIGVFDNTASAIEEGHRRFGSNFLVKQIGDSDNDDVFLEVLPAFPDEDGGE